MMLEFFIQRMTLIMPALDGGDLGIVSDMAYKLLT